MQFNTDYWNALDRRKPDETAPEEPEADIRISPYQIGISHGIGELGEGLKANIFRGASLVELGFFGTQKGFRSQPTGHTPETYGKTEREEMRQLAKINEVTVTTHASPNMGASSGYNERAGEFQEEAREMVLHEVERAVDFAADVAQGGPIVMHTGEFPRAIFETDEKFEAFPGEQKKAPVSLVDERTGKVIAIPRDLEISVPKEKEGKPEEYERDDLGRIQFRSKKFEEFEKEAIGKNQNPAKYFFDNYYEKQLELYRGESGRFDKNAIEAERVITSLKKEKENYEEIRKEAENKNAVDILFVDKLEKKGLAPSPEKSPEEYDRFMNNPLEFLNKAIKEAEKEKNFYRDTALHYGKSAHEIEEQMRNVKPIQDYGVKQTAETLARAAMYAYDVEKKKNLEKPLFIAPENWTPELYGSHPKELRELITKSRERMAGLLVEQKGMSKDEAKKISEEHVKATFDIGHLNFWRKYFKGTDEQFHNWIGNEVEGLVKDGIIGHVHLSDNFGYYDEHLEIGEGNAPIQPFMKMLSEQKFKGKLIGEPGGQRPGQEYRVLTSSWRAAQTPIYRIDSVTRSWTEIENSYFGRVPQSPYFLVGDIVPSKDWTSPFEIPLE